MAKAKKMRKNSLLKSVLTVLVILAIVAVRHFVFAPESASLENIPPYAGEPYVVIDDKNYCTVYITIPKEDFVSCYYEDKDGKRTFISRFIDDANIKYLESFNDYSEDEQKIFKKMKK